MVNSAGAVVLELIIGVISGVIGIGGGAFLAPALAFFYGMSQVRAQGTSIVTLLLPIGLLAFWSYYKAVHVDVRLALLISAGFAAGGLVGGQWGSTCRRLFCEESSPSCWLLWQPNSCLLIKTNQHL